MSALAYIVAAVVLTALCIAGALITLRRGGDQLAALTETDKPDPERREDAL